MTIAVDRMQEGVGLARFVILGRPAPVALGAGLTDRPFGAIASTFRPAEARPS